MIEKMPPTIIAMDRTALPAVNAIRPVPITQPGLNPLLNAHPAIISSMDKTAMKPAGQSQQERRLKSLRKVEKMFKVLSRIPV